MTASGDAAALTMGHRALAGEQTRSELLDRLDHAVGTIVVKHRAIGMTPRLTTVAACRRQTLVCVRSCSTAPATRQSTV
jgi:hypothetical protein